MKKLRIVALLFVITVPLYGQSTYTTSGMEIIFSMADIEPVGNSSSSGLRFAPVFNFQTLINHDLNGQLGLFSGMGLRNVGYILKDYTDPSNSELYMKKFRSYNLAIPLGIKIGNLDRLFIYGGYEIEVPFLYKEKTFADREKIGKITGWFSSRQNRFQPGIFAGVQFPYGTNVKFKYYLNEFHNRDYVNSFGDKPYEGLKSNVFYISLNWSMFRNLRFYAPAPSHKLVNTSVI